MNRFLYLILFFICLNSYSQIKPSLVEVPVTIFVNGGNTNVSEILLDQDNTKEKVEDLYNRREIVHDLTGPDADFNQYWEAFGDQWHWVQFRESDAPLLLFLGLNSFTDEREYVELYDPSKDKSPRLFANPGRLIAFKRHPFTDELILYTHLYPCCRSASHNIFTLRYINGEIKSKDRFFVGRDSGDMVGPFFPDSVYHDTSYYELTENTTLRWSPAVVTENAFEQRARTNIIAHYEKGAIYKILGEQDNWLYVVMFSGITDESTPVINPVNFKFKGVYGWIRKSS